MHLITGYSGQPHITAANDGLAFSHIFGKNNYIFDSGNKMSATLLDENTVSIGTGCGMMNGRFFEMTLPESVTIDGEQSANKRNDLICVRYNKDAETGVETVGLVVIKGTATTGTPSDPPYNNVSILDNVAVADFPIYRVSKNGMSAPTITPLFEVRKDIVEDVKADNAETLAEIKADNATHFNGIIDGTVPVNTATKLGTATVGGNDTPIFLDDGIPKPCADVLKCKELYTNNNVAPTFSQAGGTITLSDSIVNYKYIEIVFYNCLNPNTPSNSEIYTSTGKIPVKNSAIETDLALATLGNVQVTMNPDEFRVFVAKRHAKITTNKLAHSAPKRAYADIGQYGSYFNDDTGMSKYASVVYKVMAYK